jgi:hypothetical protein
MKSLAGITVLAFLVAAASSGQSAPQTTPAPAAGGTMHMESAMKHTGPGPTTKTKTEMVVGTVKTYEAGKKITVTGPRKKDYTFDLDENVTMKGNVAVGDRVKVSYSKTDGGNKVTTVSSYPATSKAKKKKKTAA